MELLIVFLPLLAALYVGFTSRTIPHDRAQLITCVCTGISAVLSYIIFYQVAILGHPRTLKLFDWIDSGNFYVTWSIRIDALTAVMLVVVNSVSTLVHIYSVGYMSHDTHKPRFMAYLSLFTFFMLILVTADDFLQLFLGWEGVGLCSYLLIGFWYHKPSANAAAIKAFVVNRVGDFGFALGILAIFLVFGNIGFDAVFSQAQTFADSKIRFLGYEVHTLTLICVLLFIGAMGKSAQLGLHTWLPDAMEGPTPVSALIHAATMVTAGVFLVARCSPLFEYAPEALAFVTIIGATTALFAGTIAITQNDIKKVIAYSTCSQLGYMFFACGVSAYSAGIFHLMTHAFFKALLFLGAGSVIHAMSDEQDIQKMGGIWKKIPATYSLFWIGSLALAGIPPFAGYFSKDIILESAYAAGTEVGRYAFWMGIAAAFLTAFYSWRLLILTFHGKPRASKKVMDHIHESPNIMMIPLYLLALGAIISGAIGTYILHMTDHAGDFWNNSIAVLDTNNPLEKAHHVPLWVKYSPLMAGLSGILLAYLLYIPAMNLPGRIAGVFSPVYKLFYNKWYFDEIYDAVFTSTAKKLGLKLWKVFDVVIIDGLGPNGFARTTRNLATRLSHFQSGYVYHYAFVMIAGMLGLITWYMINILTVN